MKLHDLAQDSIHVLTIGQGTVTAGVAALAETFPKDAFADVLGEAGLEIRGERLEHVAGKVVVTGKARLPALALPAPGLASPLVAGEVAVVATFSVPDAAHPNALAVGLRFALPAGWAFSHSFPELVLFAASGREQVDLDDFSLTEGFLHLTAHEGSLGLGAGLEASAKPGLYFEAQWHPGDALGLLGHVLQAVHLHGPVVIRALAAPSVLTADAQLPWDVRDRMPGLHLQADLGPDVAFLPQHDQGLLLAKPGFRIYNPLIWPSTSDGDDGEDYGPSRAYVGHLSVPGAGGEIARVVAEMRGMGEEGELVVLADFHALTLDRLKTALVRLAGGDDATDVLHGDAGKGGAGFGLRRATLSLGRRPDGSHELRSTGLSFGMEPGVAPWSPFPAPFAELLQIAYGSVQVSVVRPFDSARRAVLAHVSGTTTFLKGPQHDGLTLDVALSYPGFHISARQARGTKVDLGLFKTQGPGLPAFLGVDLEIADLVLRATPGSSFDVALTVAPGTSWQIGDYAMPRLALGFSYRVVRGKSEVAWHLNAGIDAGLGTKPVPLAVLLQHLGGAVAGFECSSPPPAKLQALALTEVDIHYRQGGELAIACRGELALDGWPKLECGFTIERSGDHAQTRLSAQLVFRPLRGEPLTFELRLESGSSGIAGGALAATARGRVTLRGALATLASTLELGVVPDVPRFLDVTLASLFFWFHAGSGRFVLVAATESGSTALVVLSGKEADGARRAAVLVDKTLHLGLSSLPLVGDQIALASGRAIGIEDVGIERLQAMVTQGVRSGKAEYAEDIGLLNGIVRDAEAQPGELPRLMETAQVQSRPGDPQFRMRVICYIADKPQQPLAFQDGPAAQAGLTTGSSAPVEVRPAQAQAAWLDVQRSFGPVSVRRMGIAFVDGHVRLLMDASLAVAGVSMDLQGLSLGFPIAAFAKFDRTQLLASLSRVADPERLSTQLDGLSLSYENGPIAISGGLLSVTPPPDTSLYQFNGQLLLKANTWALSVVGSFAQLKSGESSLFAYGVLNATIGGPAFFFVTGIAAGFGYNRSLTLPTLNELPEFPLVKAVMATTDRGRLTEDIQRFVYPAAGQNWVAAGVRFTSFKVFDSFALLTVFFGDRLEFGLLGYSELTVPAVAKAGATKPIAKAGLVLEARYAPDDGVLKIAAQLTPDSYILSENCHLSGGFALTTWSKDEYEKDRHGNFVPGPNGQPRKLAPHGFRSGDFVLSIGGYHPDFRPPAHYPTVPRVSANWRVNDNLKIKGSLYFALTPLAIMAGGVLEANYERGHLKAWFSSRVDFLMYWEPLAYHAHMKVNMGASYTMGWGAITKTISAQVGADVELYGPPFGGRAVFDLSVCSFTLDFGAQAQTPQKLDWKTFEERFLPNASKICLSRAAGGLIKELSTGNSREVDTWIVDADQLVIVTSSAIPCSEPAIVTNVKTNGKSHVQRGGTVGAPFGVKPCERLNGRLKSEQTIVWAGDGGPVEWGIESIVERLPRSAWHAPELSPTNDRQALQSRILSELAEDQVSAELTVGYRLTPKRRPPDPACRLEPISLAALPMRSRDFAIPETVWAAPAIPSAGKYLADNRSASSRYARFSEVDPTGPGARPNAMAKRKAVAEALKRQKFETTAHPHTRYLAAAASSHELLAAPAICELGAMQAS